MQHYSQSYDQQNSGGLQQQVPQAPQAHYGNFTRPYNPQRNSGYNGGGNGSAHRHGGYHGHGGHYGGHHGGHHGGHYGGHHGGHHGAHHHHHHHNSSNGQPHNMNPMKFKTQLCRHFKNGNCTLGQNCHFAHGVQDLRQQSDPIPNALPPTNFTRGTSHNYKTQRCKFFDQGFCKNQTSCNFAHGDTDLRPYQQPQAGGAAPPGGAQPAGNATQTGSASSGQASGSEGGANLDFQQQILLVVLQNLQQVFSGDTEVLQQLNQAAQFVQQTRVQEANQLITDVMKDQRRTPQEIEKYQTITSNARAYLEHKLNQNQTPYNYAQQGQYDGYSGAAAAAAYQQQSQQFYGEAQTQKYYPPGQSFQQQAAPAQQQ